MDRFLFVERFEIRVVGAVLVEADWLAAAVLADLDELDEFLFELLLVFHYYIYSYWGADTIYVLRRI